MTAPQAGADGCLPSRVDRAVTPPVPIRPCAIPDPWCECNHRNSGHHVTETGNVTYCCQGSWRGRCPCKRFRPVVIDLRDYMDTVTTRYVPRFTAAVRAGTADGVALVLAELSVMHRPDGVEPEVALAVAIAQQLSDVEEDRV